MYTKLSDRLERALALALPPVAVSFVADRDPAVAGPETAVPAGCSFWELGARTAVTTTADDHRFCSIGIHTHNMAGAPETQATELQDALAAMVGLDYVRESEVAALPVLGSNPRHVTYRPLAETSEQPALVLLFAAASQSLVLTEALQRVDGATPMAMGRPACALVPQVVGTSRAAMSLGCCGARAYLDALTDDVALWGLPGEKLADYVVAIETLARANTTLTAFHRKRRADVAAGRAPTVKESLARLGS